MLNKNKIGYTLLEIIFAISIFTLAITMVTTYVISGYKVNRFAEEQNEAMEHARKGIETMVEEVREAAPAENGDFPIAQADDQSFIFYSDIDVDQETEKVRYSLDGTDLKKGVTQPSGFPATYLSENEVTTVLSMYVRNDTDPIFYYYDSSWAGIDTNDHLTTPVSPNNVGVIRLNLEININPIIAPQPFILESFVQVRNLKENL